MRACMCYYITLIYYTNYVLNLLYYSCNMKRLAKKKNRSITGSPTPERIKTLSICVLNHYEKILKKIKAYLLRDIKNESISI